MIPYTEASDPDIALPKFDDQLTIYKGIIAELDEAMKLLVIKQKLVVVLGSLQKMM